MASSPAGSSRLRQEYLSRLGIQKGSCGGSSPLLSSPAPPRSSSSSEVCSILDTPERRDSEDSELEKDSTPEKDSWRKTDASGSPFSKGKDDFRQSLLRKLSYEQVWVPRAKRAPRHQTVIIFDWDDTLLCTSHLLSSSKAQAAQESLPRIEAAVKGLLESSSRMGHTFIITNAMHGWVEHSAATYMPAVLPALRNVRVVSARGKYEAEYPGATAQWKLQAFLEVQQQMNSEAVANVIALGDSTYEMDAAQHMSTAFARAATKTIKFRERPTPEELVMQLDLVASKFAHIVESGTSMKITLKRTV